MQFEPNMKNIIENFCIYIRTYYEKIFAQMILSNLQEEPKDDNYQYKYSERDDF